MVIKLLTKHYTGTAVELVSIQKMAAVISETQQANHHDIADLTCRRLADVQQNMERSMAHLDIMKSLLGGALSTLNNLLSFFIIGNTRNSESSFVPSIIANWDLEQAFFLWSCLIGSWAFIMLVQQKLL